MGNQKNSATKHDCTRNDGEIRKERKCENMRKLREKIALERNVEAHGNDEEMKNVEAHGSDEEMKNVEAHSGDEGMENVEKHIDERNEEHGGDEEMENVEETMGNIDRETMIGV